MNLQNADHRRRSPCQQRARRVARKNFVCLSFQIHNHHGKKIAEETEREREGEGA
jgi:hypothetical protein